MRHWRKMTWAIWAWTIICAVWIGTGIASTGHLKCSGNLSASTCSAATTVGAGIGVFLILLLWLIVFLLLSVIWFMSRHKGRLCPQCGEDVRKGQTRCRKCGYDYAANLGAKGDDVRTS
jgi:uncharacterized membrane protein